MPCDEISYMIIYHQNRYLWYTNVSVSSTTGALDDFDKTSVPPEAPEAPTAPDAGTSEEKVQNTFSFL